MTDENSDDQSYDWSKCTTEYLFGNSDKIINDKILKKEGFSKLIKLTITKDVQQLSLLSYRVNVLIFPKKTIKKIDIENCPDDIYFRGEGSVGGQIDLSSLTGLLHLRLMGIRKDIVVPNKLTSLEIGQIVPFKHDIVNNSITCRNITVTNFDVSNIRLFDCQTLTFINVKNSSIILDLSTNICHNDIILNNVNNDIRLLTELKSLIISQTIPFQYRILNDKFTCKNVSINNFDISNVIFNDCEILTLENVKAGGNKLDLSKHSNLQNLILNNVQNNIILPEKLYKICNTLPNNSQYYILNKLINCDKISLTNYNLNNIELKSCSYISLTSCTANRLSLTDLSVNQLNINLSNCNFRVLDYSNSGLLAFDDSQFINNKIENLLLPDGIESLDWITCQANDLVFPTIYSIKSIDIRFCPKRIYSQYWVSNNNEKIDLSIFVNLKNVILQRIKNDILLPNKLNKLELIQDEKFMYKILNNSISCYDVSIENFEFSNIEFTDCRSLELWNCCINQLFLESCDMNIQIRNSYIALCKFQEKVDIELFLNKCQRRCKLISFKNNAENDVTYITKYTQMVESFLPQILTLKIQTCYLKINSELNK